jgi:hypothetical protein
MTPSAYSLILLAMCFPFAAHAADWSNPLTNTLALTLEPRFILQVVAQRFGVQIRSDIDQPTVHVESRTPLKQFQDAIESQWEFRPHVFLNAYAVASNEIYLIDNPAHSPRPGASLDEVLAHELVHYFQSRYRRQDLNSVGAEVQAVQIQQWFRETYLPAPKYADLRPK